MAPGNFEFAARVLARPEGLVLLSGPEGSGRWTAALMLLAPDPGLAVRLVPAELERQAVEMDRRIFEGSDIAPRDRLLLDLSAIGDEAFSELQEFLQMLLPAVEREQAKLVVVLPLRFQDSLRSELLASVVEISPPDPLRVLARHLIAEGIACQVADLIACRPWLSTCDLAGVGRLVARVGRLRQRRPDGDLESWLAESITDLTENTERVIQALDRHSAAEQRTLLLAAALLEGAPVDKVFLARHRLLERLRPADQNEPNAIELAGARRSLLELELPVELGPANRMTFRGTELGETVLRVFWDELPWIRRRMADWIDELVCSGSLDYGMLMKVAGRIGERCRSSRDADLGLRLVRSWGARRDELVRTAAYVLLSELLADERIAVPIRRTLYWWARDRHLPPSLCSIVIAGCVEIMAIGYLDQAVVRLSWLTRHSSGTIRDEARRALAELAADPGRSLRVIELIQEDGRFEPETFFVVAEPRRLLAIAEVDDRRRAVTGWIEGLESLDPARRGAALLPWLETHAALLEEGQPDQAAAVRELLQDICGVEDALLDALFNANRDWFEKYPSTAADFAAVDDGSDQPDGDSSTPPDLARLVQAKVSQVRARRMAAARLIDELIHQAPTQLALVESLILTSGRNEP